jgi:hypothetical protein
MAQSKDWQLALLNPPCKCACLVAGDTGTQLCICLPETGVCLPKPRSIGAPHSCYDAFMKQLELKTGRVMDVDGVVDEKYDIRFIGKATELMNGMWRCLADVRGCLCAVEVKLTFGD